MTMTQELFNFIGVVLLVVIPIFISWIAFHAAEDGAKEADGWGASMLVAWGIWFIMLIGAWTNLSETFPSGVTHHTVEVQSTP